VISPNYFRKHPYGPFGILRFGVFFQPTSHLGIFTFTALNLEVFFQRQEDLEKFAGTDSPPPQGMEWLDHLDKIIKAVGKR